jgi:hypothetical protein
VQGRSSPRRAPAQGRSSPPLRRRRLAGAPDARGCGGGGAGGRGLPATSSILGRRRWLRRCYAIAGRGEATAEEVLCCGRSRRRRRRSSSSPSPSRRLPRAAVLELVADDEAGELIRRPSLSLSSFSEGWRAVIGGSQQWDAWWAHFLLEDVGVTGK